MPALPRFISVVSRFSVHLSGDAHFELLSSQALAPTGGSQCRRTGGDERWDLLVARCLLVRSWSNGAARLSSSARRQLPYQSILPI